jgi:hypothetical protein
MGQRKLDTFLGEKLTVFILYLESTLLICVKASLKKGRRATGVASSLPDATTTGGLTA